MKKLLFLITLSFLFNFLVEAQEKNTITVPDPTVSEYVPLTLKLDQSGSKYIRFMLWGQFWLSGADNADGSFQIQPSLRRVRLLTYAQVSQRFLILIHFGVNNLNANSMDVNGSVGNGPQFFLHGAWVEYAVVQEHLYVGGGLHYWNGISRITNTSTVSFLTLDNYRRSWATLGLSDQLARHMGIYVKGKIGKLDYRLAANSPIKNSLDVNRIPTTWDGQILYTGRYEDEWQSDWSYQGYVDYEFLDQEADKFPYKTGTYLGKKTVFNIGAGFFTQPNGTVTYNAETATADSSLTFHNVSHFAFDAFYDAPLGKGALTAYAAYYLYDYGPDYTLGQVYGTGNSFLVQAGYLLPRFCKVMSFQPYVAYNTVNFNYFDNTGNTFRAGMNMFIDGHHSKLTLEYATTQDMYIGDTKPGRVWGLVLQAQVFL